MPYMLIEGIGWQNHFVQGTGPGTGPDVNKCLEEIEYIIYIPCRIHLPSEHGY